jgi:hypothetical protein
MLDSPEPVATLDAVSELSDDQRSILTAVVDRVLPIERFADADHARAAAHVVANAGDDLGPWLTWLNREAVGVFGQSFLDLHEGTRDELLDRLESNNVRSAWTVEPVEFYGTVLQQIARAYEAQSG